MKQWSPYKFLRLLERSVEYSNTKMLNQLAQEAKQITEAMRHNELPPAIVFQLEAEVVKAVPGSKETVKQPKKPVSKAGKKGKKK